MLLILKRFDQYKFWKPNENQYEYFCINQFNPDCFDLVAIPVSRSGVHIMDLPVPSRH